MARTIKGEDYEIIPHQILKDLRDEIEAVKQRMSTPVGELEKEMLASMTELKSSINQLNAMVKEASQEVKKEEKGGVSVQLKRLNDKIDQVSKQNEQIASALLSVADTVQGLRKPMPMPQPKMPPRPAPKPMPPPGAPMPPPRPTPGPMPPPPPGMPGEMPPPPGMNLPPGAEFEKPKKKGLLGLLFKK